MRIQRGWLRIQRNAVLKQSAIPVKFRLGTTEFRDILREEKHFSEFSIYPMYLSYYKRSYLISSYIRIYKNRKM